MRKPTKHTCNKFKRAPLYPDHFRDDVSICVDVVLRLSDCHNGHKFVRAVAHKLKLWSRP